MKRQAETEIARDVKRQKVVAAADLRCAALKVLVTELKHQLMLAKLDVAEARNRCDTYFPDLNVTEDEDPVSYFRYTICMLEREDVEWSKRRCKEKYLDMFTAWNICEQERIKLSK